MHAITWMLIMAFTVSINAVGLLANEEATKEMAFEDTQKVADATEKKVADATEKKVVVETKKVETKKDVVAPAK